MHVSRRKSARFSFGGPAGETHSSDDVQVLGEKDQKMLTVKDMACIRGHSNFDAVTLSQ